MAWRAGDWRAQAAALWREILAEYVTGYRAAGDRALAEYHNKEAPLRLHDQFAILYRGSAFVTAFAPELLRYLREYPRMTSPGAEDVFYWSKDNFGLRPVLSITHLSIHAPPPGAPGRAALVGTKQIYATHYFDAALGLTLVLDDGSGGSYMIVINRARTRSLTSRFRGFVRSIVQGAGATDWKRCCGPRKSRSNDRAEGSCGAGAPRFAAGSRGRKAVECAANCSQLKGRLMVIRRIGVGSAATVFGALNALMGLVFGVFFAAISTIGAGFMGQADPEMPAFFGILFGLGAIVIMPIFYGILGVITGALGAAFYNLVAGMFGGLRLETQ